MGTGSRLATGSFYLGGICMWNMIWPVLVVIGSNCLYNICAKSTPEGINTFAGLLITYSTAALATLVILMVSLKPANIIPELGKTNWTSFALGLAIVGLEFGFINIYRAGWKISTGALVANLGLAVALIFVGALLYKEVITARQLVGIAVCALGLFLISQ